MGTSEHIICKSPKKVKKTSIKIRKDIINERTPAMVNWRIPKNCTGRGEQKKQTNKKLNIFCGSRHILDNRRITLFEVIHLILLLETKEEKKIAGNKWKE